MLAKSSRCVLSITILTVVYILYLSYYYIDNHDSALSSHAFGSTNVQDVLATENKLKSLLQIPIELADLAGMGQRVAALASMIEATTSEPQVDSTRILDLTHKMFPWWRFTGSAFTPWTPPNQDEHRRTGIVISVGSTDFLFAAHLISTLRNVLDSRLPIEVAYAGDTDLPLAQRSALQDLGPSIKMVNLLEHFGENATGLCTGGFATKPFAAIASAFQHVILVDADAVFLQAPDDLFEEDPGLAETGTLFWHDRQYPHKGQFSRRDWVEQMLHGQEPSRTLRKTAFWNEDLAEQMDAGVVCLDKSRGGVFASLMFAAWMNTREVREGVVYGHVHGDKETFWLATELSSTPYHFAPYPASVIGSSTSSPELRNHKVCSEQVLHHDSLHRPLWLNGSLRRWKLSDSRDLAEFTHWIDSGGKMQDPLWTERGDGSWCAEGMAVAMEETVLGEVVRKLGEEVERVDRMLAVVESG